MVFLPFSSDLVDIYPEGLFNKIVVKSTLYLIFLSIVLEILHYFIPERSFEFSDLFGNFFGVILIIILFLKCKSHLLFL